MTIEQIKANTFAEKYGIVDYTIKGGAMIYYKSYPKYLHEGRMTFKHIVNLSTLSESVVRLKRYNKAGESNN